MAGARALIFVTRYAALLIICFGGWLIPPVALAHEPVPPDIGPTCHAASGLDRTFTDMAAKDRWTCSNTAYVANRPVAWLRFDDEAWLGEERPRHFLSRNARHKAIAIAALDADGTLRTVRHLETDSRAISDGPIFALDLPEVRAETRAVLVRIERPHSIPLLSEAKLAFQPDHINWQELDMMLLAMVMGMLILPLFFDVSFYIVLREKFVLIHAAMVGMMIAYVCAAGGLLSSIVDPPMRVLAVIAPLVWAVGVGLSLLFFAAFVEPRAQSRIMRRVTVATGAWTMLVPGFFALQLHATQAIDDRGYFIAFLPAMIVIPFSIGEAIWRGSRAARFLAVSWLPMLAAGGERFARGTGLYVGPATLDRLLYVAIGFEVIVISVAIAYRFLALRKQRDEALAEALMHEQLSERDPLTGLMNRRAVADRFHELRAEGFDTFALIDLDLFKDVNDRHGHQVGDRALIACAEAIRGTEDRGEIAVRLGGEEFVVLLRGEKTLERAEALRQAIPVRIAREVEGLDRMVTASMGVVEIPRDVDGLNGFNELYARADQLLYEAKAAGRNRTNYERVRVFRSPPAPRPGRPSAANEAA